MNIEAIAHAFRGVIQYLDSNYVEFNKLVNKAIEINDSINYDKHSICTIGEIIPTDTRHKLLTLGGAA